RNSSAVSGDEPSNGVIVSLKSSPEPSWSTLQRSLKAARAFSIETGGYRACERRTVLGGGSTEGCLGKRLSHDALPDSSRLACNVCSHALIDELVRKSAYNIRERNG